MFILRFFALTAGFLPGSHALRVTRGKSGRMTIVGHRGASTTAPENTLVANRIAFQQGADGVEIDVLKSADGVVFLLHDSTLERTGSRTCPKALCGDGSMTESEYLSMLKKDVTTLSYNDFIRHVDVGSWKGADFSGEHAPTLIEMMAELPANKFVLCEMKTAWSGLDAGDLDLGRTIVQLVESKGWSPSQFKLIGFNGDLIKEMKTLMMGKGLTHSVELLKRSNFDFTARSAVNEAAEKGLDGVEVMAVKRAVTEDVVNLAKSKSLNFGVWVSDIWPDQDQPEMADLMESRGVESFMSDMGPQMQPWIAAHAQ